MRHLTKVLGIQLREEKGELSITQPSLYHPQLIYSQRKWFPLQYTLFLHFSLPQFLLPRLILFLTKGLSKRKHHLVLCPNLPKFQIYGNVTRSFMLKRKMVTTSMHVISLFHLQQYLCLSSVYMVFYDLLKQ